MPLEKSKSNDARERNIKEMIAAGHPAKQAVAAAYRAQHSAKGLADGGVVGEEAENPNPPIPAGEPIPPAEGMNPGSVDRNVSGADGRSVAEPPPYVAPPLRPEEQAIIDADAKAKATTDAVATPSGTPAPAADPFAKVKGDEAALESARTKAADLSELAPQQKGVQDALAAQGETVAAGGKAESDIANAGAEKLAGMDKEDAARQLAYKKTIEPMLAGLADSKIDPKALWKSMGLGSKVAVILGQAMGAFGSGYTGKPNEAARLLNAAIEQNVAAQRSNVAIKEHALEFQRANHLDDVSMSNLMRLSFRQQIADQLDAARAKNISAAKKAEIDTISAQNNLAVATLSHQLAANANVANAESRMGVDTAVANANAAASAAAAKAEGKGAKPEDIDKANKSQIGLELLNSLRDQIKAGVQATIPGAAPMARVAGALPASETQKALDLRKRVAMEIAAASYPDSSRAPPPEFIQKIEDQLPSPYKTPEQNTAADAQIRAVLTEQLRLHQNAAVGQFADPAKLNVGAGAPAPAGEAMTRMLDPKGEPHLVPTQNVARALQGGWRLNK